MRRRLPGTTAPRFPHPDVDLPIEYLILEDERRTPFVRILDELSEDGRPHTAEGFESAACWHQTRRAGVNRAQARDRTDDGNSWGAPSDTASCIPSSLRPRFELKVVPRAPVQPSHLHFTNICPGHRPCLFRPPRLLAMTLGGSLWHEHDESPHVPSSKHVQICSRFRRSEVSAPQSRKGCRRSPSPLLSDSPGFTRSDQVDASECRERMKCRNGLWEI